jgi:hypothetical protein
VKSWQSYKQLQNLLEEVAQVRGPVNTGHWLQLCMKMDLLG